MLLHGAMEHIAKGAEEYVESSELKIATD